eukprot:GHVR01118622.1.p1 GENE.GHVR01118622.1~~GHVR01118622.1.p1  ORF type:complete len:148 (+),score=25.24 GHVR01118622.1:67-510(+)
MIRSAEDAVRGRDGYRFEKLRLRVELERDVRDRPRDRDERDTGRERGFKRERSREKRSRSRSRRRDLRRSPEKEDKSSESGDGEDEDAELPEEQLMAKLMGFGDFTTSKGQDHSGSAVEHVNKKTDRMYRQYMNRKGGFNRPLDAVR